MVYRWRCFGTMLNRILGWEPVERIGAEEVAAEHNLEFCRVGGIRIRRDASIARVADGEEAGN